MQTQSTVSHYTNLYCSKHFRNRVLRLQQLCQKLNLDGVVLIQGIDSTYDEEMKKLKNWLLHGLSAKDIEGPGPNSNFDDTVVCVSKDSFSAFTSGKGFRQLQALATLVSNCSVYCMTKQEEEDPDKSEVLKVAQFYEMVHDKSVLGLPCRALKKNDYRLQSEEQMVEKWPLIQAYGLDLVGNGFFTLKHKFFSLREELNVIYAQYDTFSIFRLVHSEVERLGQHYFDNFFQVTRDHTPHEKRLQRTEYELIENLDLRHQFSIIGHKENYNAEDGLPAPRTLVGPRTDLDFPHQSDQVNKLYKICGQTVTPLHMTVEYVERSANIRFARTYFLNNLSQHYMSGYKFTQEDEEEKSSCPIGAQCEKDTKMLYHAYFALVLTFKKLSEQFVQGSSSIQELQSAGKQNFTKLLQSRLTLSEQDLQKVLEEFEFLVHSHRYNAYGQLADEQKEKTMTMIRMQAKGIKNLKDEKLGSVVFADSFFKVDEIVSINLTHNVPVLQAWNSNHKHYEHTKNPLMTERKMIDPAFNDKINQLIEIEGIQPYLHSTIEAFQDQQDGFPLSGKLFFYQDGLIFMDKKAFAFAVDFESCDEVNFYLEKEVYIEVKAKEDATGIPHSLCAQKSFYLKIDNKTYEEKFRAWTSEEFKERHPRIVVAKHLKDCPFVNESTSYKNFIVNKERYNREFSSEFYNIQFNESFNDMLLEFQTLREFNEVRGKEFIAFEQFREVFEIHQQEKKTAKRPGHLILKEFTQRLLATQEGRSNMIVIGGLPGAGKTRLANYIVKLLEEENVPAIVHVMPVQDSYKFSSQKFITSILQNQSLFAEQRVIVAVLPSYNHLKKAIFELKKNQEFSSKVDIKHILTKVSSRNFYQNRNRNLYPFLIENCMKGVTQAVIFEKSNINHSELLIMQNALESANFPENVLMAQGKTFSLQDLVTILNMNANDKLNVLYNKFFYGFEKEGKSAYHLPNQVTGAFYSHCFPVAEHMVNYLQKGIMVPLTDPYKQLVPKSEEELLKEEEEQDKRKAWLKSLPKEERRKVEKEDKRKAQLEEDSQSERLLEEAMRTVKALCGTSNKNERKALIIERIRGRIRVEGKDEEDFELIINFNEITIRPLKNEAKRLAKEELGLLVYGRNLSYQSENRQDTTLCEVMDCLRPLKRRIKQERKPENVTQEEVKALEERFQGEELPYGWYFNGYNYTDLHGNAQMSHPNKERLMELFCEEENAKVSEWNQSVEKENLADFKKYMEA